MMRHLKIILGDGNAKLGRERVYKDIVGRCSMHNESSEMANYWLIRNWVLFNFKWRKVVRFKKKVDVLQILAVSQTELIKYLTLNMNRMLTFSFFFFCASSVSCYTLYISKGFCGQHLQRRSLPLVNFLVFNNITISRVWICNTKKIKERKNKNLQFSYKWKNKS